MISNRTKKRILLNGESINYEEICETVVDETEILKVFESLNEEIRTTILETGAELENNSLFHPEIAKPDIIYPLERMLYSKECDEDNKCLGCTLLGRLMKDDTSAVMINGNEHSFDVKIVESDISGWKETDEYDYSERTLWKTSSDVEQYILSSLLSENILVGVYYCKNRYVIIEKADTYEETVDPEGLVIQLREKMLGLSCILFTHGDPSYRSLKITPEPWFKNNIYYNFTVRLISTSADTVASGNIRYCGSDDPKKEYSSSYYKYLSDRSYHGETDKPSEWEYKMMICSMKKNGDLEGVNTQYL